MAKIIKIDRCLECSHVLKEEVGFCVYDYRCGIVKEHLLAKNTLVDCQQIPDWCPLPDAPCEHLNRLTEGGCICTDCGAVVDDAPDPDRESTLTEAIHASFTELDAMSDEEFEAEMEKCKDSDLAKALRYAWTDWSAPDPDKCTHRPDVYCSALHCPSRKKRERERAEKEPWMKMEDELDSVKP